MPSESFFYIKTAITAKENDRENESKKRWETVMSEKLGAPLPIRNFMRIVYKDGLSCFSCWVFPSLLLLSMGKLAVYFESFVESRVQLQVKSPTI